MLYYADALCVPLAVQMKLTVIFNVLMFDIMLAAKRSMPSMRRLC